jgi:mono/diheme cytochrome c family protein
MPPLGKVARSNPWEALHKILNGHPGENMPALRALDMSILIDVLAYVQTLPTEK